jgi:hypothetical protein
VHTEAIFEGVKMEQQGISFICLVRSNFIGAVESHTFHIHQNRNSVVKLN